MYNTKFILIHPALHVLHCTILYYELHCTRIYKRPVLIIVRRYYFETKNEKERKNLGTMFLRSVVIAGLLIL